MFAESFCECDFVTSVPVCSDPELPGNHLSELNNLPIAGEAGGCGHDSYAFVN